MPLQANTDFMPSLSSKKPQEKRDSKEPSVLACNGIRKAQFLSLFPDAPAFRLRQFEAALFDSSFRDFSDISNMPFQMREVLQAKMIWLSVKEVQVFESAKKDTYKAVVAVEGPLRQSSSEVRGKRIETVLMKNARDQWTVCVSSQIGCAMACTFCATGTMGFTRSLTADEIVDQVRFWNIFLRKRPELSQRISNVVFMGMGEPLANYDNVKESLRLLLAYTDIGVTRITVSTVGLLPMLRKLLDDAGWPAVRLAVSVHSADAATRKSMMPSSFDTFLDDLVQWTADYFRKFDSRRRHLTFEYVMLSRVNDTDMHAEALIRFAERVGNVRINLIPYNFTGSVYRDSLPGDFARFEQKLQDANVTVTRRRTMGDDIAAACGQLIVEKG